MFNDTPDSTRNSRRHVLRASIKGREHKNQSIWLHIAETKTLQRTLCCRIDALVSRRRSGSQVGLVASIWITFLFDRPVRVDCKASDGESHCTDDVCSVLGGRERRYNPRWTTFTTWFIVVPMYLLIKHRIDLSSAPPPGKISLSSTPLH